MAGDPSQVVANPLLNALANQLDGLAALLRSAWLADVVGSPTVRASAAVGALLIVLRYWSARNKAQRAKSNPERFYVSDLSKIGHKVAGKGQYDADEFDVIIVGGGTAGCVLAARLSEDPSIRVLLLEAGQSSRNMPEATIPTAGSRLFVGKHDHNVWTEPQNYAAGQRIHWPRAKLLGGCSVVNAMMFHYGAPSDYDEWAEVQKGQPGAAGWSYKEFFPYFRKFEKYNPSQKFPDVDLTLRNAQGPVHVGFNSYFSEPTRKFIESCKAAGLAHSHDVNTHKGTLGVTKIMTYVDEAGRRVTMERAYLTPDVLARPNLKVGIHATVTRVIFDTNEGKPRAIGVEFSDQKGAKFQATALKEVVLAAGAVHTPHILMLSGVGLADHLTTLNVPVVADLPGVGTGLKDHVVIDLAYQDKSKESLNFLRPANLPMTLKLFKALFEYKLTGGGPLTTNISEAAAFVRSDDRDLFPFDHFPPDSTPEDVTTSSSAPDIEIFFTPICYKQHGEVRAPNFGKYNFMTHAVLLRPQSSGTIRLRSKDPKDAPVVDPAYLIAQNDVKVLVRAIRLLDRIAHTAPLSTIIDPEGDTHPELHHDLSKRTDAELEKLIRENAETLYHPACSARMAPLEDGGVVDPMLKVYGIQGLRIADASVFPTIVSGHTAAPVIAIAEKAADLIKADIGKRSTK